MGYMYSVWELGEVKMTLTQFTAAMKTKLKENDHKTGWETLSVRWLVHRLRQEVDELDRALSNGESPEAVTREAADVANFAYFIADNATREVQ